MTNQGVTSVLRINVTVQAVQTTVVGFAQLEDGSPAVGASVTTLPFGGAATIDASGFFSLPLSVPFDASALSIRITTTDAAGQPLIGTAMSFAISANGFSDAGVITVSSVATGPLFPGQSVTAGNDPESVISADFDGDGDLDLAVANLLGGASTKAEAINNRGEVVGSSETAQAQTRPFLFRDETGMKDLSAMKGLP